MLIGPFLFLFTGRTRREAPLDAHRPECGAYGTISPEHCVESILSEILIESMEHLMHLSEKTPSNLRTSENGCREKYQSFMNSPSTLACCQNPMGLEKAVRHNFYNHSALLQYSMVCEEFLTTISPTYMTFPLIRCRFHAGTTKKAPSILGLNQVRWRVHTRMP